MDPCQLLVLNTRCSVPLKMDPMPIQTCPVGSALDLKIRREKRKMNAFLKTLKSSSVDAGRPCSVVEGDTSQMKTIVHAQTKSDKEHAQDIANWLKCLASFDSCGRTIEQIEGIKIGALPSTVAKDAERFDPMSVLDDEFYTYTGEPRSTACILMF